MLLICTHCVCVCRPGAVQGADQHLLQGRSWHHLWCVYSRPTLAQRNCSERCSWQRPRFASTQKPSPLCCACCCMCVYMCLPSVYDVTRRETLASLSGSWMEELACYDPHPDVARMVVANKVDQVGVLLWGATGPWRQYSTTDTVQWLHAQPAHLCLLPGCCRVARAA